MTSLKNKAVNSSPQNLMVNSARFSVIGRASGSRYMARLRATRADLGTGHKNNIRWMTDVTSD